MYLFLESREATIRESDVPTRSSMVLLSETTNGRMLKLCVLMGVITRLLESGMIKGPPQLIEYAVEPVGVEIMIPSAQ